ncbi:hypothetical protein A3L14_07480 [Thermococcus thioreducens]|nr:hypothetical protein A3L14_07480 [Thermococcus thioreducens]KQH82065.1 hypothetical protein AMR53_08255 [Thermococcus thioreducens]
MPLRKIGNNSYELNSPLRMEAVYFSTERPYINGTKVSKLPLKARITLNGKSIIVEPRPIGDSYWWYHLKTPESGNLRVTLGGEAAKHVSASYVLALLPQEEEGFWIPSNENGYHPPHCGPLGYLKLSGEALWTGENFTLFEYMTDRGEEGEIYVENGFVCTKLNIKGGKTCSGPLLPGPVRFEVFFSNGVLEIREWDRTLLTLELEREGLSPILFLGLPDGNLYGMEIYGKKPVPWKEERRDWASVAGIIIIAVTVFVIIKASKR